MIPGKLRVGPVLEAKGFVVEATLKAPATTPPLRETERFAIALPSIGLAIDWSPHPVVDLFAEVSGLEVAIESHEYREGGLNDRVHLLPGPVKRPPPLVLRKGLLDLDTGPDVTASS